MVGSLFCFLGFKLFSSGIWGSAGDLDTKFGNSKIVLKNRAPGTFFAVLGAIIVIATIWQNINYDWHHDAETSALVTKKNSQSEKNSDAPPSSAPKLP